MKTMPARILLVACLVLIVATVAAISAETVDHYQAAVDRLIVPYSHGTVAVSVTVGTNEAATYALEMWTKGKDVTASVIVDASAPFMLGLAFLEKGDRVTAWWPTIGVEKTFASSKSEEEVGFGMGRLDRVIWHSDEYEVAFMKDTDTGREYHVASRDAAMADFSYGIINVNKKDDTLDRAEFFDVNDNVIETDTVSDYQAIPTENGSVPLYPMSFTYEDLANNKTTTMKYAKIEFPVSIDDSVFTLDFLKAQSADALN